MYYPGDQIEILEVSISDHIWLTNSSSTLFIRPLRYFAHCFLLLQALLFLMLDSLKRHCERLAAGHLDCENVLDTYAYAKVSIYDESLKGN